MTIQNAVAPQGRFARRFVAAYHRSLADYRFFYDDITELGNAETADHAFYYVPGICGTPGQMRFALPSLVRTRFQCLGFDWDYVSSSQLGEVAQHVIGLISRRGRRAPRRSSPRTMDIAQGASREKMLATIRRYIPRARCAVRRIACRRRHADESDRTFWEAALSGFDTIFVTRSCASMKGAAQSTRSMHASGTHRCHTRTIVKGARALYG